MYIRTSEFNYDQAVNELDEDGKSVRVLHVLCPMGAGSKKNLSITRRSNTLFGMCFKCSNVFTANLGTPSIYRDVKPEPTFSIPMTTRLYPLNLKGLTYLEKYGITPDNPVFKNSNIEVYSNSDFLDHQVLFKISKKDSDRIFSVLIRDNSTRASTKWIYHKHPALNKSVHIKSGINSDYIVLTEDIISALKVSISAGIDTLSCMGTTLSPDDLSWVISNYSKIILWFDFDTAGTIGSYNLYNTLKQFLDDVYIILPNTRKDLTKDPKDFTKQEINTYIEKVYNAK